MTNRKTITKWIEHFVGLIVFSVGIGSLIFAGYAIYMHEPPRTALAEAVARTVVLEGPAALKASGSGFVLKQGFLVTAQHGFDEIGDEIWVKLDGEMVRGEWLYADAIGETQKADVAVVKVPSDWPHLAPAKLNCSPLRVGQTLYGAGFPARFPFQVMRWTVTSVERTHLDRSVFRWEAVTVQGPVLRGMSGGPVFNEAGEIVALITARLQLASGSPFGGYMLPNLSYISPASDWCPAVKSVINARRLG